MMFIGVTNKFKQLMNTFYLLLEKGNITRIRELEELSDDFIQKKLIDQF